MVNLKNRMDILLFDRNAMCCVEIGDGDQEGIFQDLSGGREMSWLQPDHGDATALTITAVSHLHQRVVQVPPGDRNLTGQTDDSATAFGGILVLHLNFRQ